MIKEVIKKLSSKTNLISQEMKAAMEEIMMGKAVTEDIVSFLTALSAKGETIEEITEAAKVMRSYSVKINTKHKVILDTCGTGGDTKGIFNVSTVASFVAAGTGIAVAKHGNRSITSKCGSADILEALGININLPKERLEKCLDEVGIAFLFAQNLHPAMKYAMPARKQIAKRTIFNILGPLTNPACATHQLVGVYDRSWVPILASVLAKLGSAHALVVHGEDGLDEITTTSSTFISEVKKSEHKSYEIKPRDYGFEKAELKDLVGGDANYNAGIMLDILKGASGRQRDIVILNAGVAIYAADKAKSVEEGIGLAKKSIDSGAALSKLALLKEYSNRIL